MRIELITDYYGYTGASSKEQAVANATVLAGNGGEGSGYAPAYDIRVESGCAMQENEMIGSTWRQLYSRKNRASSLRFKAKPRYATPSEATEAAFRLAIRSGLQGQFRVIPEGQLGGMRETNTDPVEPEPVEPVESEPETVETEPEIVESERTVGPEPVFVHPYGKDSQNVEYYKADMKHAVLKRVRTRQIGVTVEVEYEIEF